MRVLPIMADSQLVGALELASFDPWPERALQLQAEVIPIVGITLRSQITAARLRLLLERTRAQAEELRVADRGARGPAGGIAGFQRTAGRPGAASAGFGRRTASAGRRIAGVQRGTAPPHRAFGCPHARSGIRPAPTLEIKAREVERASRAEKRIFGQYVARAAHALNSLLILARSLAENDEGNLTPDQLEAPRVVLDSGTTTCCG